jgi:predicted nucleic acid-binding protein
MDREPAKIVLETSAAIAYLTNEPESADIERLVALAEAGRIELLMSEFAWSEIERGHQHRADRLERLASIAHHIPKVARVGEWRLGLDMLGHDASDEIQRALPSGVRSDRPDLEQFLSYCARSRLAFFVTKDEGFLKESARLNVHAKFGLRVGRPEGCISWLEDQAIA